MYVRQLFNPLIYGKDRESLLQKHLRWYENQFKDGNFSRSDTQLCLEVVDLDLYPNS